VSRAFGFILKTREKLYETGVFETKRLDHPVISIGNLTLGGTGKTPLVIAIASRLRDDGWKPVVLSRGYKRTTSGLRIVSRGDGPVGTWQESGDEPFLIARRVPGAAVVVGADRYDAGRLAEREKLGNVFILDDGFQHRRLFRDVDLVAIDPAEWNAGERLLPTGRWREPKNAIYRAHAACVQENGPQPKLPIPAFVIRTQIEGIYRGSEELPVETLHGVDVVALGGIAKPERFFSTLETLGLRLARRVAFRDHHVYTRRDVEALGDGLLITTEKDAVRLEGAGVLGFVHLRVSANIPEFDRLMELIDSRIGNQTKPRA
jgi:tetraacyldisaccharide 4'-kinase